MPTVKRSKVSPTSRSLKLLRSAGYTVATVERWNRFAGIRQDLFGIFDLLCMHPVERIVAVQVTTMSNKSKRLDKMLASPLLNQWKAAGGRAQLHAWRKLKSAKFGAASMATGKIKKLNSIWQCEVTEL